MSGHASPKPPIPSHPFRWLPELWELSNRRLRPQIRLLGLALLVGVVAGVGAIVFHSACHLVTHLALDGVAGYRAHHPGGEPPLFQETDQIFRPWLLLLVPVVGGLISGYIVFTFAPEAEGHGTDAAVAAFHFGKGEIRPHVPIVKLITSAITLGTGGSGGREGPIAQIGAGLGSFIGKLFYLRPAERRILMAAGVGAGVAAIFRAPLAGALFAGEILYRSTDFESEVIVPSALACTTSYCTFGLAFGWSPLFSLPPDLLQSLTFKDPRQLLFYLALAIFVVVLAMTYTRTFYGLSHAFRRLKLRPHFKPAVGAFATGAVGLALYYGFGTFTEDNKPVLSVLSFGYGSLQEALSVKLESADKLALAAMLFAVALGKILTTSLTIGSGGSGGVFGPSMVIGGCGGGALGIVLHHFWPGYAPHPASFVIVGMAGFFAAAAKTPVSTLVIVSEMTGDYNLLLPTLWVCIIAFLLSDEQSIYHSQVESRSLSPAHQGDYVRDVLSGLKVKEFLTPGQSVPAIGLSDRLPDVIERLSNAPFQTLPVTNERGEYLGMVGLEEVHLASRMPSLGPWVVAADLMRADVPALRPDDQLDRALELFSESDRMELAVLDPVEGKRVIGIARRFDISSAYLRRVHGAPNASSNDAEANFHA